MHQYLKAIGFGNIHTKKELKDLLHQVENEFTHQTVVSYNEIADFCELQKEYGQEIGITLYGELDQTDHFDADYYTPYFNGSGISTFSEVLVERRIDREQYIGICEDPKVGISLIFYLKNGIEYMKERQLGIESRLNTSVTFSGLALSGNILLPVKKNQEQIKIENEASTNRRNLLNAAKNGDPTAIETLTLDDIDTYSKVSRRILHEDIFTIVDTYFMPYGIESDQYSIMGEILDFYTIENKSTREKSYVLTLNSNHLVFDVCINQADLLGEPAVGRRFKGAIWMQGQLNYQM